MKNFPKIRVFAQATTWLWPSAIGIAFGTYCIALDFSLKQSLRDTLLSAVANVMSLCILGLGVRWLTQQHLNRRKLQVQFVCHAALAQAFTLLWYWTLMVLLGLLMGKSFTSFDVRPIFSRPAVAWQLMQGEWAYGLIVALSYLEIYSQGAAENGASARPNLSRFFVKDGEAVRPVDSRQIITIEGAGDYTEVITPAGRFLANKTLAEFEVTLDANQFLRVHRSRIVNVNRIAKAEAAGEGRLLIHMENGETILTSRSGSKRLRSQVA